MSDEAARRPEDNGAGAIWKKQGRVWLGECPRSAEADVAGLPLEKKEASRLLGLQPFLQTSDYRSKETFVEAISRPLEAARLEGWLEGPSIGVYPEHLGTWLCAIDEGKGVWGAKTIERAMRALVWRHPWALVRALGRAHGKDRLKDAVFRMSAEAMARHYEAIFSSLAKTYKLWLVAGSILLPGPEVRQKRLQIDPKAPLVNASAVFDPQGQIQEALVYKSFLVEEEQAFLQARSIKEGPTFQTEVGRLKVLICADSWYPQSYETAGAEETELWLIPAYLVGDGIWKRPWAGYNGHEAPSDVERSDVLKKTEGEAWWAYSMATRLLRWKKACGMQVFLRGSFWELGSDGYPIVCVEGKSYLLCPPQDGEDLVISLRLAQRRRSPLRGFGSWGRGRRACFCEGGLKGRCIDGLGGRSWGGLGLVLEGGNVDRGCRGIARIGREGSRPGFFGDRSDPDLGGRGGFVGGDRFGVQIHHKVSSKTHIFGETFVCEKLGEFGDKLMGGGMALGGIAVENFGQDLLDAGRNIGSDALHRGDFGDLHHLDGFDIRLALEETAAG